MWAYVYLLQQKGFFFLNVPDGTLQQVPGYPSQRVNVECVEHVVLSECAALSPKYLKVVLIATLTDTTVVILAARFGDMLRGGASTI